MKKGEIFETQDGSHSVYSEKYGVSYHSKYGAIQESRHVFLEAGLLHVAQRQKKIRVLEIGFGTGLNAFLCLLEAKKRGLKVYYETLEAYPLEHDQVQQLNYALLLDKASNASPFWDLHQKPWEEDIALSDQFLFRKKLTTFEAFEPKSLFDVIFFDAFAPNAQPELWELPLLQKMYMALNDQGVLTTYCAKGVVKRRLKEAGFRIEALPGPPGKREMTRAVKD